MIGGISKIKDKNLCILLDLHYLCPRLHLLSGAVGLAGGLVRKSILMDSLGIRAGAKGRFQNVIFCVQISQICTKLRRYRNEAFTLGVLYPHV